MAVTIDKGRALENLSLTPLIDIVFLLLIFFLVATRFAEEEREMDVRLPTASEAKPLVSKPEQLYVNIDAQGRYYVSGNVLTLEQLQAVLDQAYVDNPRRVSVVIRGDERCQYKYPVAVENACMKAGIGPGNVSRAIRKGN